MEPQPQRICSKCIKKIRAISAFQKQCIESENTLYEFRNHIQNETKPNITYDIEAAADTQNDVPMFDDYNNDEFMYPEEIEEKFLPIFHTDLFKDDESNIAETCKDDLLNVDETESNRPDTNENPNTNECKQEATNIDPPTSSQSSMVVVASSSFIGDESENANPTNAKRKGKKSNISHNHNVDECVLESGAIAIASPKRLEKRFRKKDKTENGEIELCELCGLSFVINSNEYKKHLRSHKKKRKPFLCFECLYSFQTSKINYFFFLLYRRGDFQIPLQILLKGLQSQANL